MSKRFITLKDVEEQISNGKIYLDEKAILSCKIPQARDTKAFALIFLGNSKLL